LDAKVQPEALSLKNIDAYPGLFFSMTDTPALLGQT
jgi:hypothetical protein